jgi:hypothetical protein
MNNSRILLLCSQFQIRDPLHGRKQEEVQERSRIQQAYFPMCLNELRRLTAQTNDKLVSHLLLTTNHTTLSLFLPLSLDRLINHQLDPTFFLLSHSLPPVPTTPLFFSSVFIVFLLDGPCRR